MKFLYDGNEENYIKDQEFIKEKIENCTDKDKKRRYEEALVKFRLIGVAEVLDE